MIATLRSFGLLVELGLGVLVEERAGGGAELVASGPAGGTRSCRFLPLNTLEAMQTLTHMNFFAASTFCAIGTQCALEYTPMIRFDLLLVEQARRSR